MFLSEACQSPSKLVPVATTKLGFLRPNVETTRNITVEYVAANSACAATDYGRLTTANSVEECAKFCLQHFPLTRYIEYKPMSGSTPNNCDCDSSNSGSCSVVTVVGFTVYSIILNPTSFPTVSPIDAGLLNLILYFQNCESVCLNCRNGCDRFRRTLEVRRQRL